MTNWERPPGPLNVWEVLEGYERLEDGTKKAVKFSIQEIPNEDKRKKEVCDLMMMYYLTREPCCKAMNVFDEPESIDDYMRIFETVLDQDISVGCYKIDSDGTIGELVGVNLLSIVADKSFKDFQIMKSTCISKNALKVWNLLETLLVNANPFEIFQVDKYLTSVALCVNPRYGGQDLGYHILNARSKIGKKYEIHATSTVFSSSVVQLQAQRAGFKEYSSIDYVELVDDQGNPHFPNIDTKSAKFMMKRLP